jgi:peptidoglycan/xylan/chitin deacetylase (PgdA/CDA1 family)
MQRIKLLFAVLCACVAVSSAPSGAALQPVPYVPDPQKQVLVMMYHQVTTTPAELSAGEGHYGPWITPSQFESDLSYLHAEGFSPTDPVVALRYLSGQADADTLPAHPYVITFDDGYTSAWTNATAILQRHAAKAMMFIEGARTDVDADRLTSAQLRAMAKSGVWELESHGYAGHSDLQIGPDADDTSPYWYANLQWLVGAKRLETPSEYEARVLADLRHSRETLEKLSGAPVTVFAYPSGEYGQNEPLPPGADPATFAGEAGHSNAPGLEPLLAQALRDAGFTTAFAVVVPGTGMGASPIDAPFHFPRIGKSPQSYDPDVVTMTDGQIKLPAISPDYHWLDCKALAADGQSVWVASTVAPYVYQLDARTGAVKQAVLVPALQAGREGQPVLAAGLVKQRDGTLTIYEQKGWWDGGQPRLISFRIQSGQAIDAQTQNIDLAASWLVGVAQAGDRLIGMTEDGQFMAISSGSVQQLFSLPNDAPGWKQNNLGRFMGPAFARGMLYVADRKTQTVIGIDASTGKVQERSNLPTGADVRSLGADDTYLWLTNYAHDMRLLIRMRASQGASR